DRQACLVSVDAWEGDTGPVDLSFAFEGAVNLKSVATPPVPITGMAGAFMGASSFNQDLSGWDTSNVTDMSSMFLNATAFNGDVSTWDTSSVSNFYGTFEGASSFNRDLSGWDLAS